LVRNTILPFPNSLLFQIYIDSKAWGKTRKFYYGRDDEDLDEASHDEDGEVQKLEELEALKLQKKRVEAMNESDFLDNAEPSFGKLLQLNGGPKDIPSSSGSAASLLVGDTLWKADEMEPLESEVTLESLQSMDADTLATLVETQVPEVDHLLEEFEERWGEVRQVLGPCLKWMEKEPFQDVVEGPAKAYMSMKYRIVYLPFFFSFDELMPFFSHSIFRSSGYLSLEHIFLLGSPCRPSRWLGRAQSPCHGYVGSID
jgi:hypothetical protein